MRRACVFSTTTVLVLGLILGWPLAGSCQPSGETQKALDMISDFADRLCKTVPIEGSDGRLELSGKAKAELNELLKKIANIGIEGAAKYQQGQYKGLLQKDLTGALEINTNCRLQVLKELKEKLLNPLPSKPKTGEKGNATMSEPDTAPGEIYESVPQSPSRLSGAQVSQITGIRLPGQPTAFDKNQYPDVYRGMVQNFEMIATENRKALGRIEFFQWTNLDYAEAREIHEILVREVERAGFYHRRLERSQYQEPIVIFETFQLRNKERYFLGGWYVIAYDDKNTHRYVVIWMCADLW